MRKTLSFIFSLMLLWQVNASDTTRVLFIGNSITYYNDMPIMFQEIANNQGKNTKTTMYAPGGTGFVNHVTDANVYDLFRNNEWDIVVLQPGSGESAGSTFPVDTTIKRGRILVDSIYRYSPCAEVYLYEIPYGVPSAETWTTYFSVQTTIRDSVLKMADSLQLQMIPAGECARAYYSANPNLLLHNSYNDIHPSAFGSFLTASAFYTGIFQESVAGCTYYSTIEPDSAQNFLAIADSVIIDHLTDWRIGDHQITSDFDYTISGNNISFHCLSSNYSNLFWDFGDGYTSASINPSHTYLEPDLYTATLYSYNTNGCRDSVSKQIYISPSSSDQTTITHDQNNVYPNPATNTLWVNIPGYSNLTYKIIQISGREVKSGQIDRVNNTLDISTLQNGPYIILFLENNQRIAISKFFKIR